MQAKYGMELELMCVEKVCILMNYDFLFYVEKICFKNIPILFEVSGYQVVFFSAFQFITHIKHANIQMKPCLLSNFSPFL